MFRLLRADEIECRISTCNQYGVGLLLYKDARCDMNILDERVGPFNWQRSHSRDNANCTVSIYDKEKGIWISKEDTGTESYTEKEKGLASDSFKRACFCWGIGRELYTAPNMFVFAKDLKTLKENINGRYTCNDYFEVLEIEYQDRNIVYVKIVNKRTGKEIEFGTPVASEKEVDSVRKSTISPIKAKALKAKMEEDGVNIPAVLKLYKVTKIEELTENQHRNMIDNWEKVKGVK